MGSISRQNRQRTRNMIVTAAFTLAGSWLLQTRISGAAQSPPAPPHAASPSKPSPAKPAATASGDGSGYIAAPLGTENLTTSLTENSIELFSADDFAGTTAKVESLNTTIAAGTINEMPQGLADSLTSLRWNLGPGIAVVFYEDAGGRGERLVLWGKGQAPSVSRWDFNDKASRWAWYDLNAESSARVGPQGAKAPSTAVPECTIQLFRDQNFKGDMQQVAPVTATKSGELQRVDSHQSDSLSSMRWNLPTGVIVMLYQDADGHKQQIALWGEGEVADLDAWDFNDKASRWSWGYITPQRDH